MNRAPLLFVALAACPADRSAQIDKTSAPERARRRAYDGAPPVIPHPPMGARCVSCHHGSGLEVPNLGFAPPSPHAPSAHPGSLAHCPQCHVFQKTEAVFRRSTFTGLPQDLRRGPRLYPGAPPVIPHDVFMRENCATCHSGPAAREPIRTTHPERVYCRQCHVARSRNAAWAPTPRHAQDLKEVEAPDRSHAIY